MSSIHYKFRAELDYKTLQFDGLHIRGEQLVREICSKENLKLELFELQLQNAHTKKMYSDDELIPRNSSIIVQRFPRKDAAKVQKVQAGVNSGMVNQPDATSSTLDPATHIASAEFENMDESERLNHIRDQSTRAYDPSNFRRRPPGIMTGPPPPTYTCNRCYQPGHWYKNCPMLNTKRTTGIPSQELMETTADDPSAMLHPSGKYVVPIMHWKARQDTLSRKLQNADDGSSSPAQVDRKVPPELLCPLCQGLFKEAIVTSCCGNSYCAECIEQIIVDPENRKCPGTDCGREVSPTSIIPNKTLRDAAAAWLSSTAPGSSAVIMSSQEPEQIRIRIGLKSSTTSSTPSTTQQLLAPAGISPLPQQPLSVATTLVPTPVISTVSSQPPKVSVPGFSLTPGPTTTTSLVQDVSLPPPHLHQELPPGIPGITGLSQFAQPPPGVPGLSAAVLPHPPAMSLGYGIPMFTSGFPPAVSSVPRASAVSGFDEWNAFLQSKDRNDKRREQRDKDRTRRKDRHDSRSRRRRDSSSSSSSSQSSSSGEDRLRRKRREKESLKKRRSVEKERQRRTDDHRRDRDHRDTRSSGRSKDVKASTSSSYRRDRDDKRRRERRRDEDRKRNREDKREDENKDSKDVESKDEDEIDGIIAEYGNVQVQESEGDVQIPDTDEHIDAGDDSPSQLKQNSPSERTVETPADDDEPAADEEPIDDENTNGVPREISMDPINHAMETSEAEVAETKEEEEDEVPPVEAEMEESMENEENYNRKEKESQSSTANTADEDEESGKKSKKHKKSKKSKKHHRKEEDGEDDEGKKNKKHKKHKKEKKSKKEKRDDDKEYDDDKKDKKDNDKGRKREENDEDSDMRDKTKGKHFEICDGNDSDKKDKKTRKNDLHDDVDRRDSRKESDRKETDERSREDARKERGNKNEDERDAKNDRKRDRETEVLESDAPKNKVKREEKKRDDRQEYDREKERKKVDKEKDRKKNSDRDHERETRREKEKAKEKEKDREREKEKEKEKEREKEKEKEKEKERERERERENARKEKSKTDEKEPERPRRSVHERLQKADNVKHSSTPPLTRPLPSLSRKPVSFTVTSSKAAASLRFRQYSSSSSTKEQEEDEEEDRSKHGRRKKEETDVESVAAKEKKSSSRQALSSGESASKHKNIKIKFDL